MVDSSDISSSLRRAVRLLHRRLGFDRARPPATSTILTASEHPVF
ncbi:hypothetical protein LA76x_5056 [Lysobacter antibioticus]|uniref:Uncharacterized protein n=1 Tax=Lysobacter antibioticus TaxID=84531 RepID=A0A0S2FHX9_LYSAN|nr:hypothetical protein LA76x_5056 [Lysobacter antibioticus]